MSERDPAVKRCCDMFGPYVTGCVANGTVCPGGLEPDCRDAWKRGAHLGDVEPGLRKMAARERYFVPKQCLPPVAVQAQP